MKATVRTERFYDIEIGGVMKEGWREVSSWNGLKELERKGEKLIVVTEDHGLMFEIFGPTVGESKESELKVVSASPSLHEWLRGEVKA
ncbi:hypothetical protein [Vreelandella venusta]|uniref:hypothetical protein n=1 Tax=Vreelandella venusta TaxID=44935 RepID=UPI0018DA6C5B|nr:hypothetical protein [Halomonas venusta]QPI62419.1 hypothetical protein IR195_10965 [Halomonas venusta]